MIKKTYIPGKPRNPKLGTATGTSGVGKTEFNQVAGSSHEHNNKGVLDQITEAMLVGAAREVLTSIDTETELTNENILSALRVLSEISKAIDHFFDTSVITSEDEDTELTDENTLSSLRVLLEIAKNNVTFLEDLKEQFLSKIEPDTAQKLIKFVEGLEIGAFSSGALGSGAAVKMVDGTSYAEVDNLTVRQKATFRELIIESLKHIGGQLVLTPARMKCTKVVEGSTYYKCYFDTGDGEVSNEFVVGDQARCQVFTGSGTKFYWRLVTSVGDDWINLSKAEAALGSDIPESGDEIVQLGNIIDTARQSAIILSAVGVDAPSWKQYEGINSFSLEGKATTYFSSQGNLIAGETKFTSKGTTLNDLETELDKYRLNKDDFLSGSERLRLSLLLGEIASKKKTATSEVDSILKSIYLVAFHKDSLREVSTPVYTAIDTLSARINDILNGSGIIPADYKYRYEKALVAYFESMESLELAISGAKDAIEAEIKRRANVDSDKTIGGGSNELREYDLKFDGKYWNSVGFVEVDMSTIVIKKIKVLADDINSLTDEQGRNIIL